MTTAKVWVLKKPSYEGLPTMDNFELTEEKLPPLKQDEILLEAVYLSVDPYHRVMHASDGLVGEQVASFTAYFSFTERCQGKPGEIILITAAAGAVGSVVGQLAKNKGFTVIGVAGSKEKCDYIRSIGFDYAINYKTEPIAQAIDQAAPEGVDIYFDNVGGAISDIVYGKLRYNGKVIVCGQISQYNTGFNKVTNWGLDIIFKELNIQGFMVYNPLYQQNYPRARQELIQLIQQGKLKAKEHITEGFENLPQAFIELFTGANFGKAIIKA